MSPALTLLARFLGWSTSQSLRTTMWVGEELEGDYFEDGEQELGCGGDVEGVLHELGDLRVAFGGDRDDTAAETPAPHF